MDERWRRRKKEKVIWGENKKRELGEEEMREGECERKS